MKFREDIQGLRAIAVLFVFFFHLSAPLLPGGFIGVDMFFVISGYLVTGIIYSKLNKGTFSILDFYKSRVQRIVPAYFCMLLIVSMVVAFLFINSGMYPYRMAHAWAMLFNSNNYFASLDTYFGTANTENPLLHTWTLAVEMQFYFLLPFLLIFLRNKRILIVVLSFLTIGLLVYSTYNVLNANAGVMYFSLLARIPEFLLGSLAAILKLENYGFIKKRSNILSIIGIAIIFFCVVFFSEKTPFPGIIAFVPCVGTLLLLLSSTSVINNFLSKKTLVFIGEISYSVYLWHWPLMALLRYHNNSYEFTMIEGTIVLVLTVILSLMSYYIVEKTMRDAKGIRFFVPFAFLGASTAAMFILTPAINSRLNTLPDQFTRPSFGLSSHGNTFQNVGIFGNKKAISKNILLIGDSHALVMKKYLDIVGIDNGFSFKTITNDCYPTLPGIEKDLLEDKYAKYFEQYKKLTGPINQEIAKTDLVILQFADDGDKWKNALKHLLEIMRDDQRVIVLSDFPSVDKNPIRINRDIVKRDDVDNRYVIQKKITSVNIINIINNDKRAKYLDLANSDVFDDAPFYRDTLMYYDQGHLNEYGSTVYAERTCKRFMDAIKDFL